MVITLEDTHGKTQDNISMTFPCKSEYIGVVRLTASAIANRMGFNIEEIEDIKVSVAEACSNAIRHGNQAEFHVCFSIFDEKLAITVEDDGMGIADLDAIEPDLNNPKESGLGIFIIRSLMDEVELITAKESGTRVAMMKFLTEGI